MAFLASEFRFGRTGLWAAGRPWLLLAAPRKCPAVSLNPGKKTCHEPWKKVKDQSYQISAIFNVCKNKLQKIETLNIPNKQC